MSASHLWTWEDIMHLPEQEQPELIAGQPYARAIARGTHGRMIGELYKQVSQPDGRVNKDGWWISIEPAIRLSPHDVVGPDLAGWRKSRLAELPDDWPLDVRPDWVCEVLSPGTARHDRSVKAQLYAASAIPWYWLVDGHERLVEVLELSGQHWRLHGVYGDGDQLALPPFDAVELQVSELFLPRK